MWIAMRKSSCIVGDGKKERGAKFSGPCHKGVIKSGKECNIIKRLFRDFLVMDLSENLHNIFH